MSLGRTTGVVPINPEDYVRNAAQLEIMQQTLDQWKNANDMGLANYEQMERELQHKLESEEWAANQTRQRLLELRSRNNVLALPSSAQATALQPAVSSSARIEEIPSANNAPRRNWSHNVPTAGPSLAGSVNQVEIGRNPYQHLAHPQSFYYSNAIPQSQSHTQQNHSQATQTHFQVPPVATHFQGVRRAQAQTMNPPNNVIVQPIPQAPPPSLSNIIQQPISPVSQPAPQVPRPSSDVIQQHVPQVPQNTNPFPKVAYQTPNKNPALLATNPLVKFPDHTANVISSSPHPSSIASKSAAVPVSQTLSETRSTHLASTQVKHFLWLQDCVLKHSKKPNTKIDSFRKRVSEWAKCAPERAFCSTRINGIELYPYKEATSKNVGVLFRDPKTSQYRDITSIELEDILEGRYLPTRTPQSTNISQPQSATTSAQSSSTSMISAPNTPIANGATQKLPVQPDTPQRTPAQANKATIARDVLRVLGRPSGVLPPLNLKPQNKAPAPKQLVLKPTPPMSHGPSDASQTIAAAVQPADGGSTACMGESHTPPSTRRASNAHNVEEMQASVPGQKDMDIIVLDSSGSPAGHGNGTGEVVGSEDSEPNKPAENRNEKEKPEETVQNQPVASGSSKPLDDLVSQNHDMPFRPKTPLFLPSPEPASLDVPSLESTKFKNPRIRKTLDYVEIPPAPEYVKDDRERLRRSKRQKAGNFRDDLFDEDHEAAQTSLAALVQEAYAITPRSTPESSWRDVAEEAVWQDTTTRLQYSPCRWRPCNAVMNSVARLERHLKEHVENMDDCEVVNCQWHGCGRSETSKADLLAHVIHHVRSSLACPYEGCENTFRTLRQLSRHCLEQHSNGTLKPSADPSVPSHPTTPPECPEVLPSYMVVARHVSHHPMTRERHQSASAAVLKRIMPRTHDVYGLKRSQLKRRDAQTTPPLEDDYDFVAYRASPSCRPSCAAKIRHLPDLRSSEISTMVHNGLTLWRGDAPLPNQEEVTEITPQTMKQNSEVEVEKNM
ncbi:hypothetical protein E1B28_004736 [Marasmius oreades]|uniref:C2H2-type domain-containing protein n=1 Tax=Marasmius oreades TaxID=181124 RepID=A0A9P7UZ64_9AGAR|nr:uncharacterized protein E1B28_004736 [Marasmius oreades]KAG7097386.1 hypothetical protein E1B28_004736 [Marasmius oreades]